jgi:hypothetical protein
MTLHKYMHYYNTFNIRVNGYRTAIAHRSLEGCDGKNNIFLITTSVRVLVE